MNPQVERLRSEVEKERVRREEMTKLCEEKAAARERELRKEMEVQRKEIEIREVESRKEMALQIEVQRKEMALVNEKAKVREAEIRGEVEGLLLNFITKGDYEGLRELVGSKLRNDLSEQTQK